MAHKGMMVHICAWNDPGNLSANKNGGTDGLSLLPTLILTSVCGLILKFGVHPLLKESRAH